ncbi:hypothetical protein [Leptospira sp. 'Mane']|uniref:hypothetical protein n=1 Tax=Leptospira sp. 'Mane' TaxID=3387407 RepID=UPI00398AB70C
MTPFNYDDEDAEDYEDLEPIEETRVPLSSLKLQLDQLKQKGWESTDQIEILLKANEEEDLFFHFEFDEDEGLHLYCYHFSLWEDEVSIEDWHKRLTDCITDDWKIEEGVISDDTLDIVSFPVEKISSEKAAKLISDLLALCYPKHFKEELIISKYLRFE